MWIGRAASRSQAGIWRRIPQAGWGGQWGGRSPVPVTKTGLGVLIVHPRGLLGGVRGVTLKSTELERLGFSSSGASNTICDRGAGMGR